MWSSIGAHEMPGMGRMAGEVLASSRLPAAVVVGREISRLWLVSLWVLLYSSSINRFVYQALKVVCRKASPVHARGFVSSSVGLVEPATSVARCGMAGFGRFGHRAMLALPLIGSWWRAEGAWANTISVG